MSAKRSYTLCDFKCPLHGTCARYLSDIDKTKTDHYACMPYNLEKQKCSFYEQLTEDDLIDRIQSILKPKMN